MPAWAKIIASLNNNRMCYCFITVTFAALSKNTPNSTSALNCTNNLSTLQCVKPLNTHSSKFGFVPCHMADIFICNFIRHFWLSFLSPSTYSWYIGFGISTLSTKYLYPGMLLRTMVTMIFQYISRVQRVKRVQFNGNFTHSKLVHVAILCTNAV